LILETGSVIQHMDDSLLSKLNSGSNLFLTAFVSRRKSAK
jgi:hypothetical protein